MGYNYCYGRGVDADQEKGKEYFDNAITLGCMDGYYGLGQIAFDEGDCVVRKQQFLERKCVKGCKNPLQGGFMREIRRDFYLDKLIKRKNNGLIKVITGIRRCGKSYLLNNIFFHHLLDNGVDADHIIRFAFDSADDLYLIGESLIQIEKEKRGVDPEKFMEYIRSKVIDEGMYYLLLDEVQMLDCFEAVLNGYLRKDNMDIFVTGSNAKLLSKDIATEFAGRGDEIYIQDITKRNRVKNIRELEDLLNILSSAIGSLTNPEKLKNTFKTVKKSKITANTIKKYLDYFEDSFLIESAQRFDIKGKAYIETPKKYYFSDLGLRNARINFRQFEQTHSMENVIYNELRMRGYSVDVGVIPIAEKDKDGKVNRKQLEIDFVCNLGSSRYYIQSAYSLPNEAKRIQEIRPFRKIDDSFKKIIITKDIVQPHYDEYGILTVNIYDFLLDRECLLK